MSNANTNINRATVNPTVQGSATSLDQAGFAFFCTTLGNYANDAAAAAATPAVPVGGLYRNGSVLMIRVA